MNQLAELRIQLAEARIALRQTKDDHDTARAIAEQEAIAAGVNGKNDDERKRNFAVALKGDVYYQRVLANYRETEALFDRLQAQIAAEEDQLSQHRLAERERNDRAIERLAMALEKIGGAPAGVLSRLADLPF